MRWVRSVILLGFVVGCGDDAVEVLKEPVSLRFDFPAQVPQKENNGTEIVIPLLLSEAQTSPVTIRFDIIGVEVVNGSDFSVLSANPVVIKPGDTGATVNILLNDNEVVQLEERSIFVRVRSVEPASVEVKLPAQVVIVIEEDDCPAHVANVEVWIGDVDIEGPFGPVVGVALENPDGLCSGKLNVRGRFFGSQNPESTLTIVFTQTTQGATSGTTAVVKGPLFTFSDQFQYEATGTYNEETGEIVLNFLLFDQLNSLTQIIH